ncbi:hypothetical protein F2P81_019235 [Scophthalmus maximus]|uniref:Uncharacterized protein n=1 Tax=Scophthalmus maximus TaxID=52904 RepID=A0A6A4S7E7_SCOMX|nr:hypothetical protein F2P81_019235 [Scophthalmus maximus]
MVLDELRRGQGVGTANGSKEHQGHLAGVLHQCFVTLSAVFSSGIQFQNVPLEGIVSYHSTSQEQRVNCPLSQYQHQSLYEIVDNNHKRELGVKEESPSD